MVTSNGQWCHAITKHLSLLNIFANESVHWNPTHVKINIYKDKLFKYYSINYWIMSYFICDIFCRKIGIEMMHFHVKLLALCRKMLPGAKNNVETMCYQSYINNMPSYTSSGLRAVIQDEKHKTYNYNWISIFIIN